MVSGQLLGEQPGLDKISEDEPGPALPSVLRNRRNVSAT